MGCGAGQISPFIALTGGTRDCWDFLAGVFVLLMAGIISRKIHILYFPVFIMNALTPAAVLVYSLYGLLCVLPLLLNIAEDIKWRSLRSKI